MTDDEFDRLEAFLGDADHAAMNWRRWMVTSPRLICGPLLVSMSEALPNVLGDGLAFDGTEQANEIPKAPSVIGLSRVQGMLGASAPADATGARPQPPTAP